jgi:mRNA interferase HigB
VRIISPSTLNEHANKHPKAKGALSSWRKIVENAEWKTPQDVKNTINSVDTFVTSNLKRTLYIFNICGNDFRLICGMRFPKNERQSSDTKKKGAKVKAQEGWVYVRELLTHSEYDQNKWKASNDKI